MPSRIPSFLGAPQPGLLYGGADDAVLLSLGNKAFGFIFFLKTQFYLYYEAQVGLALLLSPFPSLGGCVG